MVVSLFHEKRDTVRVRSAHLLAYSNVDPQNIPTGIGMAKTLNISENGILIEAYSPLPRRSTLEIQLNVGDESLNMVGEVIREVPDNGKWRVAVKFINVSAADYGILNHFLNERFHYTRYDK
ncbi:PilZ domain-containing protein [candidate division CSSED10-310 bacterium]|uniref:PilZ domain-containing protein n=1 Tax=candidate division CSSED10-310 bacterium TaxID=2855610 RepID=A0ABV6Z397_UNCC1